MAKPCTAVSGHEDNASPRGNRKRKRGNGNRNEDRGKGRRNKLIEGGVLF